MPGTMKLRGYCTPLLSGLLLLPACISRPSQTEADRPVAAVENDRLFRITEQWLAAGSSDTVRFGRMHSGEIAVLPLWLANETGRPIVPADFRTSCGCATLEYENLPIAPGQARKMMLTFDSRGEWGWQFKRIDLPLAGTEQTLRIFVEAEVE